MPPDWMKSKLRDYVDAVLIRAISAIVDGAVRKPF